MSTQEHPDPVAATFGANEWLIEELFEQYQKDPALVDPAWWDFFKDYEPGNGAAAGGGTTASPPSTTERDTAPRTQDATAPAAASAEPAAASAEPAKQPGPASRPGSDTTAGEPAPTPRAREVVETLTSEPAPEATAQPAVAGYTSRPASRQPVPDVEDGTVKLRGPAARVVKNMEASLEVPTATSVRAVPAKLLVDNRIVINNHLARGRGGKVSFTHLIGYAVVEALSKLPEMNAEIGRAHV